MKISAAVIGTYDKNIRTLAVNLSRKCRMLIYTESNFEGSSLFEEIRNQNPSAEMEISECKVDASWEAEIILMGTDTDSFFNVAEKIKPVVCQKIIVITADYPVTELKKLLPHSKIVSVANPEKPDSMIIASEDPEAGETVKELLFN